MTKINKTFFAFFRDNDDYYPLSQGFYEYNTLSDLRRFKEYYFYHIDNDEFQKYEIHKIIESYYNGFKIVIAYNFSYLNEESVEVKEYISDKYDYSDCLNCAKEIIGDMEAN